MAEPAKKLDQTPDPSEQEARERRANFKKIEGSGTGGGAKKTKPDLKAVPEKSSSIESGSSDKPKRHLSAVSESSVTAVSSSSAKSQTERAESQKQTGSNSVPYNPDSKPKKLFLARHKKATVTVAIMIILVLGGIFGFFGLKAFEVVHLMNVFSIHNLGPSERTETRATVRLMQYMADKNKTNPEKPGRRAKTGRLISDGITNYRLDKLEGRLKDRGYEWVYADADGPNPQRATHLRTSRGEVIELNALNDRGAVRSLNRQVVNEAIPAWRVFKRHHYYRLINYRTGWSRKFFVGDRHRENKEHARKKLSRRATEASNPRRISTGNDKTDEELDRARDGQGVRKPGAIGLGLVDLVGVGCLAQSLDESSDDLIAAAKYYPYLSLSSEFLTIADQMKDGGTTVTSEEVGEVNELLHKAANEEEGEEEQHFDESAAWQRANQNEKIWGEDLASSARFDNTETNPGKALVGSIADAFDFPGSGAICSVLGSPLAQVVDFLSSPISGALEFLADQTGLTENIFEEIINFLAGKGGCNADKEPRQLTNCIDAGLLLSVVEHNRTNGGAPKLSEEQLQTQRDRFTQGQRDYAVAKGFWWQRFSPENPTSVTVQFALAYPKTAKEAITTVGSLPQTIFSGFMSLLRPDSVYAANRVYTNYGLDYIAGYTDEEIDSIDPEINEGDTDEEGSVIDYLTYFCWEVGEGDEKEWVSNEGECDQGKYSISQNMKEYIICSRTPYFEAEEKKFSGGKNPGSGSDEPCLERFDERSEPIVSVGMYIQHRGLIESLAELTAEDSLGTWRTFNLFTEYIKDCVEPNKRGTKKPHVKCYDPTHIDFIFFEDPFEPDKRDLPGYTSSGGDPPTGDPPTGDPPTGDPPTGDPPTGDPPTGDPPTGDPPTGDPPTGDPPGVHPNGLPVGWTEHEDCGRGYYWGTTDSGTKSIHYCPDKINASGGSESLWNYVRQHERCHARAYEGYESYQWTDEQATDQCAAANGADISWSPY
jgi:hypothetical protein